MSFNNLPLDREYTDKPLENLDIVISQIKNGVDDLNLNKFFAQSQENIKEALLQAFEMTDEELDAYLGKKIRLNWIPLVAQKLFDTMTSLPEGFEFDPYTKVLTCSQLETLPEGFVFPPHLKRIEFKKLKKLPASIKFPSKIELISFQNLEEIEPGFKFPNHLTISLTTPHFEDIETPDVFIDKKCCFKWPEGLNEIRQVGDTIELDYEPTSTAEQIREYEAYATTVHKKTMKTMVSTELSPEDHSHIYGTPSTKSDYHDQHVLFLDGSSVAQETPISPAVLSMVQGKFPHGLRLTGENFFVASFCRLDPSLMSEML